jgi:hemolysin activation/secretion protein
MRPMLQLSAGVPLTGGLVGAFEAAGGAVLGEVPVQRLWYLGGRGTVRGYSGAAASGTAFWRGRVEVAGARPVARVVGFVDAGWAGPRGDLRAEPLLLSAGAGASLLDGVVRADLARALRGDAGWRFTVYLDGGL